MRHRARFKNEILAVLHRNLKPRPPMADAFGVAGRQWLAALALPVDERDTVNAGLRQIDFLTEEITTLERDLARYTLDSVEAKRLMTVPGVGMITATVLLAAVGDIARFPDTRRLVGYLGLDPRVRQSGTRPAHTGRITKEGATEVRHVLVEAALTAVRTPGPLKAFYERTRGRRGHQIAIVATSPQDGDSVLAPADHRTRLRLHDADRNRQGTWKAGEEPGSTSSMCRAYSPSAAAATRRDGRR